MKAIILIASMGILLSLNNSSSAQTSIGNTLNSSGQHSIVKNLLFDYSIGEMVLVATYQTGGLLLSQGLLQPITEKKAIEPEAPKGPNNFITPNGDGRNDAFVLPDAESFPEHHLRIFDRAGRLLFESRKYQNDWNGYFRGKLLNEDTYYYIWLPGPNYSPIKGFITIIHDR